MREESMMTISLFGDLHVNKELVMLVVFAALALGILSFVLFAA
eukprot:CAMPEP_0114628732 /NCGR_PEP_ID=MMETSP0168-20121206/12982_1 /TAXON_ID=95228 ORGANISM="Vannella sp., Strain DIVA3 517/6/12" /NCGR_SAMPLE_ID=MMETSP0168 /ASSEMBLY_ACC=CAM_ASM_000044 /LENGTH=42 /DNA_ID= /DNA_START= /DNA_END= /DNA_ORIENTATION=